MLQLAGYAMIVLPFTSGSKSTIAIERVDASVRAAEPFARDLYGKPLIPVNPTAIFRFGLLIRRTEELLLKLFSQGLLSGTTHTCIGQEICQIAVVRALTDPGDVVLSNHRNHGHFLTYSGNFLGLVCEVMGREAGLCGGIGGSQHLAYRHFHCNGVQAGMTAIAVGLAMTMEGQGASSIATVLVGDGTLGEGLLYESMNLASVWKLPVLFVVEHNGIAQTTSTNDTIGGSIEGRGKAFGLTTWQLDDSLTDFLDRAEKVVETVRRTRQPGLLVIDTRRLGPHSKGDDLRDKMEMQTITARDPLMRMRERLTAAEADRIESEIQGFVDCLHVSALGSAEATKLVSCQHIFERAPVTARGQASEKGKTVRGALNDSLRLMLMADPRVTLLGEDLHDPYGGAFKVTTGLSSHFTSQVISTPISEAGIVGAGIGLAMAGRRPIVEIMFADFVTLALDQLYNHAVKFAGMFDDRGVPLVVRVPAGGRRGYGPTHSQSPEGLLAAVPGLTIVFPSQRHAPGELLRRATLDWPYPTIFMEHKLLYGRIVDETGYHEIAPHPADPAQGLFPTLTRGGERPDVTLVCYGDTVAIAEAAAKQLEAEELSVEIVVVSLLSPFPRYTLTTALSGRERIVVIEEAPAGASFGTELGTALLETGFKGRFARVSPPPIPIPAARTLEAQVMPDERDVIEAVAGMILPTLKAAKAMKIR
jgi:2-oxoisovalerate dehydrogenase E1 component